MEFLKGHNIYIIFWILYYLQGTLYPSGSIISQGILVICLLFDLIHFYKLNFSQSVPRFFKGLNLLLVLLLIYGLIAIILQPQIVGKYGEVIDNKAYLQYNLISLLPIYSCYYYISKGYWGEKRLMIYAIILLALTILEYYRVQASLILLFGRENGVVNNISYKFVSLMPCLFLFSKKRIIQIALLVIMSFYVILGFKRGAIIIGAACFIYFMFQTYKGEEKKWHKMGIALLFVAVIGWGYVFLEGLIESNTFMQYRYEQTLEGESSGRDQIYTILIGTYIEDYNLIELFFGRGANASFGIAGDYAHQDWLELLIDCGILGVIVFSRFFINAYTCFKKASIAEYKPMYAICLGIIFCQSMFSMGYQSIGIEMGIWLAYGYFMMNNEHLPKFELSNNENTFAG